MICDCFQAVISFLFCKLGLRLKITSFPNWILANMFDLVSGATGCISYKIQVHCLWAQRRQILLILSYPLFLLPNALFLLQYLNITIQIFDRLTWKSLSAAEIYLCYFHRSSSLFIHLYSIINLFDMFWSKQDSRQQEAVKMEGKNEGQRSCQDMVWYKSCSLSIQMRRRASFAVCKRLLTWLGSMSVEGYWLQVWRSIEKLAEDRYDR